MQAGRIWQDLGCHDRAEKMYDTAREMLDTMICEERWKARHSMLQLESALLRMVNYWAMPDLDKAQAMEASAVQYGLVVASMAAAG
eukprot:scaffold663710_cov47-Prasinocladus_malaysianus.AAC.1